MSKKYEFVEGETRTLAGGAVLHRIRAVRDIPRHCVKAGDLGGYIEKEGNLPHDDSSWVSPSARVIGKDSRVRESGVWSGVIKHSRVEDSEVWDSSVDHGTVEHSTVRNSDVRAGVFIKGEIIEFIKKRASAWKKEGV